MQILAKTCFLIVAACLCGTATAQTQSSDQGKSLGEIARQLRGKKQPENSGATGQPLASSFQEAAQLADAQEGGSYTRDYFKSTLLPYYARTYAVVFKHCFDSVSQPDSSQFSFVVAIGTDGRVMRLYRDGETNIFQCVRATLEKETFPAPPVTPFYLHIDMKFTDEDPEPPASQSGENRPPLVMGAGKYSYTFAVPQGWEFSFEQAESHGARLVFFPKGGSFDESNSIVYVTELVNRGGTGADAIARVIANAKQDSPTLQVRTDSPLTIAEGGRAAVRILTGARDPRQAKEALAFIQHDEAIVLVVLTTKSTNTWQHDYAILREIVSGHKFFTCSSPNLAVPCRE